MFMTIKKFMEKSHQLGTGMEV